MRILYQKLNKDAEVCISLREVELPCFVVPWHYHPEVEIIYIEKSTGMRFVGDHSEPFEEGDAGLIGANLPHVWKNDLVYQQKTEGKYARALVAHFQESIFKGSLALLPEMEGINHLLSQSQFGIKFTGNARLKIGNYMKGLVKTSGIEKLLKLVEMLDYMSKTEEKQLLTSQGYTKIRKSADFDRFDMAHKFMIDNFQKNITLRMLAKEVNMTATSFCRYFKKRTTKTYITFLNEIRIGHACKLLLEGKMNIAGICYESGFNNLSNFNHSFKKVKGVTPSQYLKTRALIAL
jgi:AraC-like DNA-binding protein